MGIVGGCCGAFSPDQNMHSDRVSIIPRSPKLSIRWAPHSRHLLEAAGQQKCYWEGAKGLHGA